jgi:hypothetical protein
MEALLTRGIHIKGRLVRLQQAITTNGISIEEASQKMWRVGKANQKDCCKYCGSVDG